MICIESRVLVISLSPPLFHPLFFRETNPILLSSSLRVLTRIQDFFEFIHDQATTGEYHIHGSFDARTTLVQMSARRRFRFPTVPNLLQTQCREYCSRILRTVEHSRQTSIDHFRSECARDTSSKTVAIHNLIIVEISIQVDSNSKETIDSWREMNEGKRHCQDRQ